MSIPRRDERTREQTHLEGYCCEDDHRDVEHRGRVLSPEQTRVEETKTGNHDPHEGSGSDDPGHVAQVEDDGGAIVKLSLEVVTSCEKKREKVRVS